MLPTDRINNSLNVTDIDYQNIRENLKDFLKEDPNFTDYDFEGSALSTIIDLLSYVTHINAINANIGINETFLETAQFRGSVVGHARTLGYTPKSATAPAAFVDVVLNDATLGVEFDLPRGYKFKTTINGRSYLFVTVDDHRSNLEGVFEGIKIVEGTFKTAEYIYDPLSFQKYLIQDKDVDVSTLSVEVQASRQSAAVESFVLAKELPDITSNSNIFFLSENPDSRFEVSFGDGAIGRQPEASNIIRLEYVVTNKDLANDARVFSITDPIAGISNVSVRTLASARGGTDKEPIESIKINAPLSFASQNRGVTAKDYEAIIRENFNNVLSVRAWGGEDNIPEVYGKVFISIIPREADILSLDEKSEILNNILIPKSVVTVIPEIVDPEFLFLNVEVAFNFNASFTNLSEEQLKTNVKNRIRSFGQNTLNQFEGVFRYSNFLNVIDTTDDSVLNSFARVFLEKRFVPVVNERRQYIIDFINPLFVRTGDRSVITNTSEFTVGGVDRCRFKDFPTPDPFVRRVAVVTGLGQFERVIRDDVGFLERSRIVLNDFVPDGFTGASVSVEVVPESFDLFSGRNIVLSLNNLRVSAEVDLNTDGRDSSGSRFSSRPIRTLDRSLAPAPADSVSPPPTSPTTTSPPPTSPPPTSPPSGGFTY